MKDFIDRVLSQLTAGKRVRATLPGGGRLHIDRPLPFLCIYRAPAKGGDAGTRDLVKGEASFLMTTPETEATAELPNLVGQLAEAMTEKFGGFLVVEIWSAPDADVAVAANTDDIEPTELRPDFVITTQGTNVAEETVAALRKQLRRITVLKQTATVDVDRDAAAHPPDAPGILKTRGAPPRTRFAIGIRVRPIYRDHETGDVYPAIVRTLKRGIGRALKQAFFSFAKTRTNNAPAHFYSLGRRAMVKAVWNVDRRLSEISDSFSFLLQVTPVNAEGAWREFHRSRFEFVPHFYYRPLAVEPSTLKRRLYEVRIEDIEDPTLAHLFRQRQDELDRSITMLSDIGTSRFLLGSRQVFGDVADDLQALAEELLRQLSARSRDESAGTQLSANEFAARAREEVDYYRSQLPSFAAQVHVRSDMFTGLLCSDGDLLIGHKAQIPENRVAALLHHEVGTHLLTYYNGLAEPFQQLHSGFAGYDALQEGLAVLSEYLVGGLSRPRMRMLAARVIAARLMVDGATFVETFRKLDRDYGFSQRVSYTIAMRTFRGGGLTKDAVYLRGLVEVLAYLNKSGQLDPLFVGKIATEHISLIKELQHRGVLKPPVLRPRYLELPGVAQRIEELRNGTTVLGLLQPGA